MRVVVLLIALSGLFGMHGLSDHGMPLHSSLHSTSALSDHSAHDGHPPAPAAPSEGGHPGAGLMGLCLAVLVAAVWLGVAGLLRARHDPLYIVRRGALLAAALVPKARDPVPPDLSLLSVQRC